MLLIIDNYDSFVYNIARYCVELGQQTQVRRNDAMTLDDIACLAPTAIIISPGPASPAKAGLSLDIIRRFSGNIPILGICLGHQCIGAAFGGRIAQAQQPMHGRSSFVDHPGSGLFHGLPNPLMVGRYHSLVVVETPSLEQKLQVTARAENGEIMAISHYRHPTIGVQFHPESILSRNGHDIFRNFFQIAGKWWSDAVA